MNEHYDPTRDYEREQAAERDLQRRDRNAEQFLGDGWPVITAEEFELAYAKRSGVTVEWLREQGRIVKPCSCGDPDCQGWQMASREELDDLGAGLLPYVG